MVKLESNRFSQLTIILSGLLIVGIVAWSASLLTGGPDWGTLLTNFIYLASITQGALAISVILRITSTSWSTYFYRLAAAVALSFFPFGLAVILITFVFKNNIFYWANEVGGSLWYNSFFFFSRNLIPFLLFYFIAGKLFNISINPEADGEDNKEENTFKKQVDKKGYSLNHYLLINGFLLLVMFVFYETVMAWDLGMTLNKHFADTVYTLIYMIGSIHGGVALLVVVMWSARKYLKSNVFGYKQFESLSRLMLAFSILWFYVWYTQFFSIWFVNLPEETETIYLRIFHGYGIVFFASIILTAFVPFVFLIFKKVRDSITGVVAVSGSILAGLWLDRYLIIVPALFKENKIVNNTILNPVNIIFTLGFICGVALFLIRIIKSNPKVIPTNIEEVSNDPLITEPTGWQ